MKKIKTNNKKSQQKAPMKNSTKILLYSLAGVLLLIIIVLVMFESKSGRITIRNDSDYTLEYVKAFYVDAEGAVNDDVMLFENLQKGDKSEILLEKIDLSYLEANLEVRFKFEGYDELFVDAGYFNDIFNGRISLSFSNTEEDKVLLKIKASPGVLPSPQIRCDEEHVVNLAEGYVEE